MPEPTETEKQKYMFTDDIKFFQKAVVFHPDKNELFLVLKRPANAFQRPNDWDLAGGNVSFGELHEDSLRREILEESNLKVGIFMPVQIVTTWDNEKEIYYIFTGFHCQAENSDVKISAEHCEYRWVTKEEFLDLTPAQFLVDLVVAAFERL